VAIGLCLCLTLGGCTQATAGLSGNYVDDTVSVAQTLLTTIALPQEDPTRQEAEAEARQLINGWTALYRPRQDVNGLSSFTTMQTALNALAAHYAGYANRPLPEALRSRLEKELKKAEVNVVRGA
jgi:photosystem II Psb27 protein